MLHEGKAPLSILLAFIIDYKEVSVTAGTVLFDLNCKSNG